MAKLSKGVSFPAVECITPHRWGNGTDISYEITPRRGQSFTEEQRRELEDYLLGNIGRRPNVRVTSVEDGVRVYARPPDSLEDDYRHTTLVTLQQLLKPRIKFSALGVLIEEDGDVWIAVHILGRYSTSTLRALKKKIRHAAGILRHEDSDTDSRIVYVIAKNRPKLKESLLKDSIALSIYRRG